MCGKSALRLLHLCDSPHNISPCKVLAAAPGADILAVPAGLRFLSGGPVQSVQCSNWLTPRVAWELLDRVWFSWSRQ